MAQGPPKKPVGLVKKPAIGAGQTADLPSTAEQGSKLAALMNESVKDVNKQDDAKE